MNILITGGASGLGLAITRRLASNPQHHIFFTFNESEKNALLLEKQFKNCKPLHCNFKDAQEMENLLDSLTDLKLDILINNAFAGKINKIHFHQLPAEAVRAGFESSVMPVVQLTQRALQLFRKKKFGKIITILTSSLIGKPPIGWSDYVAVKAYLLSMSKSWAVENASFNITSNCISPAFFLSELTSDTDERLVEEMVHKHPLKILLTPDEVAASVEYFVQASQQINGINLVINSAADVL